MATSTTSKRFLEGPLSKWTNVVNGWQYRWFVLDQSVGLLSYYTSKDKMKRGSRRGCFRLKRAIVGIDDEDDCTFTIHVDNKTYHFQAQNTEEREQWVHMLESCIRRLHQPVRHLELSLPEARKGLPLTQRVAESEVYYSILDDQIEAVSRDLNSSKEATHIRQTAKTMLEALRQCIDVIKDQLADTVSVGTFSSQSSHEPMPSLSPAHQKDVAQEVGVAKGEGVVVQEESVAPLPSGLQEEEEEEEEGLPRESSESSSTSSSGSDTSSMASGDDEQFYDAEPPSEVAVVTSPSVSVPPTEGEPSDIEEEQDYDERDDTSSIVAQNKSLIMHMLSQVRLGMDLTKVTLPTFILEKRSLLEMYAEIFAHPDVFASIPDYKDPKERIVAIVKYYVSSFHAARKGNVAKKPYNPILGEIFHCYWDLPNSTRTPPSEQDKKILESGPVPYASYNSVTFIAEQVSHHPPITSFYAECPSKNMYLHAAIWNKSKFLGLSLGVHNVGQIHLHLLDYGEEYTATLPNGYARSILTVPWLELGGKCQIRCAQTGFGADVEFHCKPFYGGKKHRVTADIFHVSDKKPFMRLEGEWNGVMYVKHLNGDQEVFIDTLTIPTFKKKLKKLSAQDPGESRRRWHAVTEALWKKDVDTATEAKHELEEKQRADKKERQRLGVEWKQAVGYC